MNIGEAASASGLPVKTIQYYEEIGLVTLNRTTNGYRVFGDADTHMLMFLAHARSLGFSIEDCRALLGLYEDQGRASADVKDLAQQHLTEIGRKIAELKAMRKTLSHHVENCNGDNRPDCPILDGLASSDVEA